MFQIQGQGYQLKLDDETYIFPEFERAPPEGYFTQDYVACVSGLIL